MVLIRGLRASSSLDIIMEHGDIRIRLPALTLTIVEAFAPFRIPLEKPSNPVFGNTNCEFEDDNNCSEFQLTLLPALFHMIWQLLSRCSAVLTTSSNVWIIYMIRTSHISATNLLSLRSSNIITPAGRLNQPHESAPIFQTTSPLHQQDSQETMTQEQWDHSSQCP